MADVRISSQNILPVRTQPVAKAEAVRAAQRAFFDAAMNAANAAAPAKAPQTTVASVSAPARASAPAGVIQRHAATLRSARISAGYQGLS